VSGQAGRSGNSFQGFCFEGGFFEGALRQALSRQHSTLEKPNKRSGLLAGRRNAEPGSACARGCVGLAGGVFRRAAVADDFWF